MYFGQWLCSAVKGYVPRSCADGDKWSHWKVVLKRERYSDSAFVHVVVELSFARKVNGRWVSGRKPQIVHWVSLGNLNNSAERLQLHTVEMPPAPQENNPAIVAELSAALVEIDEYATECAKKGGPIWTRELEICVELACQKEEKRAAV